MTIPLIPINRLIAFIGPVIAVISASVAAWLISVVNVLGIPGLDKSNLATYIAAAITWVIVTALHAIGGLAWFKGHHIVLQNVSANQRPGLQVTPAAAKLTGAGQELPPNEGSAS